MPPIDIHVLDHTLGYYRLFRTLTPEQEVSTVEVPIRIQIDWRRLAAPRVLLSAALQLLSGR